jgi:hypothetical protein
MRGIGIGRAAVCTASGAQQTVKVMPRPTRFGLLRCPDTPQAREDKCHFLSVPPLTIPNLCLLCRADNLGGYKGIYDRHREVSSSQQRWILANVCLIPLDLLVLGFGSSTSPSK